MIRPNGGGGFSGTVIASLQVRDVRPSI
jgi:hypothetical protein